MHMDTWMTVVDHLLYYNISTAKWTKWTNQLPENKQLTINPTFQESTLGLDPFYINAY